MEKKCDKKLIERVRVLRARCIAWDVVAQAVGVTKQSLMKYKNPESESYNEQFAAMAKETQDNIDCGEIKTGQFEQSVKHKLKRTLWEFRQVDVRSLEKDEKRKAHISSVEKDERRTMAKMSPPPQMPPLWLTKPYLIDYANQVLDLIVDPKLNIFEIRAACLLRIEELTVTVRVKIESEQEVDPNQQAVKNVLTNAGKEDKRWNFGQDVKLSADDPLSKLLAEIGGIKKGLPEAGKIPDYNADES